MTKERRVGIALGVTGSIAAYKAAELVRLMKSRGWDVRVIMTRAAERFVSALTFRALSQNPVAVDMFEEVKGWAPAHISLAERADLFVIAPCTANVVAKLALGLSDDLLTCTALAAKVPAILAPAMNEAMWLHPATRANVALLKARGVRVLDVGKGGLACGREGRGRMAEPEVIMAALTKALRRTKS
ncbi:MAG: flavoprotein [Verrucomicrobiota bacterium]|nr:flavoprotein [Verrucomicrobiota bacterium]